MYLNIRRLQSKKVMNTRAISVALNQDIDRFIHQINGNTTSKQSSKRYIFLFLYSVLVKKENLNYECSYMYIKPEKFQNTCSKV